MFFNPIYAYCLSRLPVQSKRRGFDRVNHIYFCWLVEPNVLNSKTNCLCTITTFIVCNESVEEC